MKERIVSAQTSSNLGESLVNDLGDIDVVRACGMAGQSNPLGLSIWRWRYAGDERELWKMRVLHHLANDVCKVCLGRGYGVIENTPVLNGEQCTECRGEGRLTIQGEAEQALVEEIAALEREVAGNIMRKLA